MNILDDLSAIQSLTGLALVSVVTFAKLLVELIKSKRRMGSTLDEQVSIQKYKRANLQSCFTSILFSVVVLILFKMYSFWFYRTFLTGDVPNYSVVIYFLCLLPLPAAILGSLIGLAIGKRYV